MPRRKKNIPYMNYHDNNDDNSTTSASTTISKKLSKSNEAKRLLKPHLRRKKRELEEEEQYYYNNHSHNHHRSNNTNRNQFQIILGIILTICVALVYYYHNNHSSNNNNNVSLYHLFFNPPESSLSKKKRKRTINKYEVEILERKKRQNNNEENNNYYNSNSDNNDVSLIGVKFEAKNEHGESIPNTDPPQLPIQNNKEEDEEEEEEEEKEENIIKPAIAANEDKITNALKIAYVVPILECSIIYQQQGNAKNEISLMHDALTILKHSIHRLSIHNSRSKYNYEMIAFLHQDNNNNNCPLHDKYISLLQSIGYKIMIVGTPINLKAVKGMYLKGNIAHTRHGAHQDWAKLNIYTLLEYPLVVLVDIRTLFLQPLDEIFDIMLNHNNATGTIDVNSLWNGEVIPIGYNHIHKHKIHKSVTPSLDIHAIYTKSYIDIKPVNNNWKAGINLSMLIIKPSAKVFDDLLNIIREGDYRFFVGWGGKGYANFEGSMQSRGLLTYYYDYLYPSNNLELDRCIYHNTADIPYVKHKSDMICRENINITYDNCMDCRKLSLSNIKVFHYGACTDPWKCFMHTDTLGKLKLCRKMHHYWYRLRNEVENSWERSGNYKKEERKGNFLEYQFLGYCDKDGGYENYIPMKPFGG